MQITLKTLQQQTFKIEIDESKTVKDLKTIIENEKGASFPALGQRLIYAGKILQDDQKIDECNIKENSFVVVMVSKPKGGAAAAAPTPAPAPAPAAAGTTSPAASTSQSTARESGPAPAAAAATTTTTETATESKSADEKSTSGQVESDSGPAASGDAATSDLSLNRAASALLTGHDYEETVSQMIGMGFSRQEVVRALRASFNNPDRAVEYLMTGIPESILRDMELGPAAQQQQQQQAPPQQQQQAPPPPQQQQQQQGQSPAAAPAPPAAPQGGGGGGGGGQPGGNPLAFLTQQPQFQQLRQLVRQNPQILPSLLNELGRNNPQLFQLISSNQEHFHRMLTDPEQEGGDAPGLGGGGGGGGGGAPGMGGGAPPPGTQYIQVTQEEKAAIERLVALGFSEAEAIQAYFACDKNENLAANFLFQQD